MGMAASQARFLGLTARKSNNEYEAQQINQQRLDLASQQEKITLNYQEKMNNRMLYFNNDGDVSNVNKQLTYWDIVNTKTPTEEELKSGITPGMGYRLVDTEGNVIVPNYPGVNENDEEISYIINKYEVTDDAKDNTKLQNNIKNGTWILMGTRTDEEGNEHQFKIPYDEATFITEMRAENPKDDTDREYWRLYNTNVPKVNGKYQELTFENLTTMKDLKIEIWNEKGKTIVPELPAAARAKVYGQYSVDKHCVDPTYLEEKLRNGEWFIQTPNYVNSGNESNLIESWSTVPWQGLAYIEDGYNTMDDAAAEAEYDHLVAKFHKMDKMLELRLQQLEAEHKALETEIDSVSKVLKDNVDSSFKTFA